MTVPAFTIFDELAIGLMSPAEALSYFQSLTPSLAVEPEFNGRHERQAFTLAQATDEILLVRVQNVIQQVLATGQGVSEAPELIEAILEEAGVGPTRNGYCFLPGTYVEGRVIAASQTRYNGPAVRIKLDNGYCLSVTVNHPVMTSEGWNSSGRIKNGDILVCYGQGVKLLTKRSAQRTAVDNQDVPARIEDVFQALAAKSSAGSDSVRPVGSVNFHGDLTREINKIRSVRADWKLMSCVNTLCFERCHEFKFVLRNVLAANSSHHCPGLFDSCRISSNCTCLIQSLSNAIKPQSSGDWRKAVPIRPVRIGESSDLDPRFFHAANKRLGGDSQLYRKLAVSFPGKVTTNRVIKVERISWTGHVYDLQTATGFIVANGIVTGNSEMVLRTNLLDSYNVGAWRELQQDDVRDYFPVWQYSGIDDGREGADHAIHFGRYFPAAVPFTTIRNHYIVKKGQVITDPTGVGRPFFCRCTLIPVDKYDWEELQAQGVQVSPLPPY